MSSLRQDSLTGRWVIIAAQRQGRPNEFRDRFRSLPPQPAKSDSCPFCEGRESHTPAEVFSTGRRSPLGPDTTGWRVRVVPNKYPAVHAEAPNQETLSSSALHQQGHAQGGHEVVICCPGHEDNIGTLSEDHLTDVLSVVRGRIQKLGQAHSSARYVLAFGNQGPEAGATLAHTHLQIITTPVVPALVVDKIENFIRHKTATNQCLLCQSAVEEEAAGARLIAANSNWVALTPWSSRFPCEMRLIPRRHCSSMLDCTDTELADLAKVMSLCLKGLESYRTGANYNLVFHNTPLAAVQGRGYGNERLDGMTGNTPDLFHWHVEILPRLSRQAGFEAGTGFAINSMPPEEAADILRPESR